MEHDLAIESVDRVEFGVNDNKLDPKVKRVAVDETHNTLNTLVDRWSE
jgi:hypothetical protein